MNKAFLEHTTPPPGTLQNRQAARSWRSTAWIAGGFTFLVGLGMLGAHLQFKSSDPWRSPVLLNQKEQLRAQPRNEAIRQQIRALDLQLRERYFHLLNLKATGVYLLLGGTLVLVYAGNRVHQLHRLPPLPQPDPDKSDRLSRHARLSRNAVAACSLLALAGFSLLAFSSAHSPRADLELLSAQLGKSQTRAASTPSVPVEALRTHWPRFRGYQGAGVAGGGLSLAAIPVVGWQVPTPAPGFNSPLVWGGRVFFTGGDAKLREVFCLDAVSGALQWRQRVDIPPPPSAEAAPEIPDMTGHAASTAATDGERLYALFGTGELAAFTLDGKPVWTRHLGPPQNPYGHATSLVTWQECVIVQLDQGQEDSRKSKIMTFDGRTGEVRWEKTRTVGASWATPIVIEAAGKAQVITLGLPWVMAYQADEGAELWRAKLLEGEITPSPVFAAGRLFVVDPGQYQLLALRPDGLGDVTGTHVIWRVDGDMPDISSPVSDGERVFVAATGGTLTCFDAPTGKALWKHELDVEIQSSPSLAGDTLLLLSTAGDLIAVGSEREFHELWRMKLEDQFHASPAFANGRMYLRGARQVWCLGTGPKEVARP